MKRQVKLLTPDKFKKKVEAALRQVNQALIAASRELSNLQSIAEDQCFALDEQSTFNNKKELSDNSKAYNIASDIQEWADEMAEMMDGIDDSHIRVQLSKSIRRAK